MLSHLQLDHKVLARVDALVARECAGHIFRSTGVGIVLDSLGSMLVVKSTKSHRWGPPQGGIKSGESAIMGLFRELGEETGIDPSLVEACRFCYTTRAEIPNCQDGRRKSYHYFLVKCRAIPTVTLQMAEVDDFKWVNPQEVADFLAARAMPQKVCAICTALRRAGLA